MAGGSKTTSRIKKKGKQKLVFAKDRKQVIIAAVVLFAFLANTIYMIGKSFIGHNPPATVKNVSKPEDLLEQQQGINASMPQSTDVTAADNRNTAQDAGDIYSQTLALQDKQSAVLPDTSASSDETVDIMVKKDTPKRTGKTVLISVSASGRPNPFLPETEEYTKIAGYSFLPAPPETLPADSEASKVMTTTISGILYDKYSPSAIINIEGADYLVKQGDVIKNYRVLSIGRNQVVVKLGNNVYQAGVGQLLIPTSLNYNTIANLNKKFGGNDVSINVRKKGY